MKGLKQEFEVVCNKYIDAFEEKQELDFNYWVADKVGEIAVFDEYYHFNFNDIRYDIDTNQPKSTITAWYDSPSDNWLNYFTYTKIKKQ